MEILFRAKRKDWKKLPKEEWWVEGYYVKKHGVPIIYENSECPQSNYVVDEETVSPYTGLNDNNNVKIFKGNICEFSVFDYNDHDTQYKGVVVYSGSRFMLWKSKESEYYGYDGGFDLDWVVSQDDEFKIIGNIFDNPEMLKEDGDE